MKKDKDIESVSWDYYEAEDAIGQIKKTLKKLGLFVYSDPTARFGTFNGIIISKRKLNKQEIKENGCFQVAKENKCKL